MHSRSSTGSVPMGMTDTSLLGQMQTLVNTHGWVLVASMLQRCLPGDLELVAIPVYTDHPRAAGGAAPPDLPRAHGTVAQVLRPGESRGRELQQTEPGSVRTVRPVLRVSLSVSPSPSPSPKRRRDAEPGREEGQRRRAEKASTEVSCRPAAETAEEKFDPWASHRALRTGKKQKKTDKRSAAKEVMPGSAFAFLPRINKEKVPVPVAVGAGAPLRPLLTPRLLPGSQRRRDAEPGREEGQRRRAEKASTEVGRAPCRDAAAQALPRLLI